VPAKAVWELKDTLPTGRKLPAMGTKALSRGLRFSSASFDEVFTTLTYTGGRCESRIEDPTSGRRLKLVVGNEFRECAVYNPQHRHAICIEPYTCVPDAFRLTGCGADGGLRILASGQSWQGNIQISVE
jgi:aldose 1-epimerase